MPSSEQPYTVANCGEQHAYMAIELITPTIGVAAQDSAAPLDKSALSMPRCVPCHSPMRSYGVHHQKLDYHTENVC
jgi:hypothetical protein